MLKEFFKPYLKPRVFRNRVIRTRDKRGPPVCTYLLIKIVSDNNVNPLFELKIRFLNEILTMFIYYGEGKDKKRDHFCVKMHGHSCAVAACVRLRSVCACLPQPMHCSAAYLCH